MTLIFALLLLMFSCQTTKKKKKAPIYVPQENCKCISEPKKISKYAFEVLDELNFARTKPKEYAEIINLRRKNFKGKIYKEPGKIDIKTNEGVSALDEAVSLLRKTKPMPPLTMSGCLILAAQQHVNDIGPRGIVGHYGSDGSAPHDRIEKYTSCLYSSGECIAFGSDSPRDVVIDLLIDDGVRDRGHRKLILDADFIIAGVATGMHKVYRTTTVIDFSKDNLIGKKFTK